MKPKQGDYRMGIVFLVLLFGWMTFNEWSNGIIFTNPLYIVAGVGILLLFLFGAGFFIAFLDIRHKRKKSESSSTLNDMEGGSE